MNSIKSIVIACLITTSITIPMQEQEQNQQTKQSEAMKASTTTDELWIDQLRKHDPIAASIIVHLVTLNPSLAFCLQLKQSEIEQYFKDHPEILENLLKISQQQLQQQDRINNSHENAEQKLSLNN